MRMLRACSRWPETKKGVGDLALLEACLRPRPDPSAAPQNFSIFTTHRSTTGSAASRLA